MNRIKRLLATACACALTLLVLPCTAVRAETGSGDSADSFSDDVLT